jgi:probable phosphomutase (TIGR03848 family)
MSTLLLLRHATTAATGKTLGGRTEAPLDEGGRAQAGAAAERLVGVKLAAVYASPLARTMETARIVAASHGLGVRPAEGLLEVEYGKWTDKPLAQAAKTKLWPVIQQRPSQVGFPEGETIRGMQLRAVDAVEDIVARHPKGTVLAVSHADVIKAIVSFYLGQPLDLFQRIAIAPASLTVLRLGEGGPPMLLRLNDEGPMPAARERRAARHG